MTVIDTVVFDVDVVKIEQQEIDISELKREPQDPLTLDTNPEPADVKSEPEYPLALDTDLEVDIKEEDCISIKEEELIIYDY